MQCARSNMEKVIGRYMQEIRDIVQAGLSRRELLRLGLVSGSAGLLALSGLRRFTPYWGHAQLRAQEFTFNSPPNTPFTDPLPIPHPLQPTTLAPAPTKGPNSVASAVTGFSEAVRPDHQHWTDFGGHSDTLPGFTGPQYELVEQAVEHDFYPARDGVPSSPIWTFVDATTGHTGPLRVNAHYGQPAVVRIHNALPEENNGFGINQE